MKAALVAVWYCKNNLLGFFLLESNLKKAYSRIGAASGTC
jgi:hypothetical protein